MSFRKAFRTMKTTESSKVYKMARRYLLTDCSFCRPHRGDNSEHNVVRNWKKYRKRKYKTPKGTSYVVQ